MTSAPWHTNTGYEALEELIIGDGVTSIYNGAFLDCTKLKTAFFGNTITSVGANAFNNCQVLEKVNLGNRAVSVGAYAFYGCYGLMEVDLGNAIESIGENAFYYCRSLKKVIFGPNLTTIKNEAFRYGPRDGCVFVFLGDPSKISAAIWSFYDNKSVAYYPASSLSVPSQTWGLAARIDWIPYISLDFDSMLLSDGSRVPIVSEGIQLSDQSIEVGTFVQKRVDVYTKDGTADVLAKNASISVGDSSILSCSKERGIMRDNDSASIILNLTGNAVGSTTLTIDCGNGVSKTVAVTVKEAATVSVDTSSTQEALKKLNQNWLTPPDIELDLGVINGPKVQLGGWASPVFSAKASVKIKDNKALPMSFSYDTEKKVLKFMIGYEDKDSVSVAPDGTASNSGTWNKGYEQLKSLYKDLYGKKVSDNQLWNKYSSLRKKLKESNTTMAFNLKGQIAFFGELSNATGEWTLLEAGGMAILSW